MQSKQSQDTPTNSKSQATNTKKVFYKRFKPFIPLMATIVIISCILITPHIHFYAKQVEIKKPVLVPKTSANIQPLTVQSPQTSATTPTTPPAQPAQTANNNLSKPDSSAPVTCQTEDIPYTTTTQYIANQYNTYSYDEGGINGSEMVCTDGTTDVYSAPLNKVHYVGAIDKAAQDLAAYNQIVAYCRSNNPSGGEITTCVDENLVTYDGYAAYPNNPATEAFLNSLQ